MSDFARRIEAVVCGAASAFIATADNERQLAALIAPRPLLIANSDKDPIFPLDGVIRVHSAVARIYALHKASEKLGLLITEGPHKDTQDLQVPA